MTLDTKHVGAGLATLGVVAMAGAGYLRVQTPEAAACEVDRARLEERIVALTEVKETCKAALASCAGAP